MKATHLILVSLLVATLAGLTRADERDDRVRALEKRVEQLEKLLLERTGKTAPEAGVSTEVATAPEPAKPTAVLSAGASGFSFRSADTNFAIRFRGFLRLDSHWYFNDAPGNDNNAFIVRRVRPILEGTVFRDFTFLITPEFGGPSPVIRDAWINYAYSPAVQLRVGKMKAPGSLERWESAANTLFIERALVSNLWPTRDLGVMLHGDLWPGDAEDVRQLAMGGVAHYDIGAFNGVGDDLVAGNSDFDGETELAARLFFHPFLRNGPQVLKHLGLGISGTYGKTKSSAGLPHGGGFETEGEQGFFTYLSGDGTSPVTANVIADGTRWRVGPQAYWYYGPFGLIGEYGISSQKLQRQDGTLTEGRVSNRGWTVSGSWVLTGEDAGFKGVMPKRNFNPREGGWGAVQLAARYSVLDLDDSAFPTFADPTTSATRAAAWTAGLNWYLNRNIRASAGFTHTDFKGGDQGPVTGRDENAFFTAFQLVF